MTEHIHSLPYTAKEVHIAINKDYQIDGATLKKR